MKRLAGTNMREVIEIGDTVVCDQCNTDFTNSIEIGGFVFSGHGYCPRCAPKGMKLIKNYGEERFIEAVATENETFKNFILRVRNGNNRIVIQSF